MSEQIIIGIVVAILSFVIIACFKLLSRFIKNIIKELGLKIDLLEIKLEAWTLALHNGQYETYQKELKRLLDDYNFKNKK